ncbi:MAG TPA: Xaa-Pro dipeptidase [Vicinamibacteria bacterium]|nr:Xaa-Pro dipeptidase [Vicinamibacteria bacterium]
MNLSALFTAHIEIRQRKLAEILEATGFDALIVSSGEPHVYFADDRQAPFCPVAHFAHWCPIRGPFHLLRLAPGSKPLLIRYAPEDYWYEPARLDEPFWLPQFELEEAATPHGVWKRIGRPTNTAYIGNETQRAEAAGLTVNPEGLLSRLDWDRAYKTEYEIASLEEASALGARGHVAARKAFEAGGSELDIHNAFVIAVGVTEEELPYTTIVALDEKSAFLHYEAKRKNGHGRVLLIDAAAQMRGYAADITRTHVAADCDSRFVSLRDGMEKLQQELCREVRPRANFLELHLLAHHKVAALLADCGILKADAEEANAKGWSRPFLPHGLGHHLGLQVHDVGGHLRSPDGAKMPPPPEHPFLRNTRPVEPGQVFTMEPGLYFIDMLLRPFREGGDASRFDWKLIDELTPNGGIRIEDDVVVTEDGHRNMTREYLPIG